MNWASYRSPVDRRILSAEALAQRMTLQLISDAQKYLAALRYFGRKINLSEHPLVFIEHASPDRGSPDHSEEA